VPGFNYANYAESLGLLGVRVERPDDIGKAWDAALSADRPCVVDFVTDPNVPPLPPHIDFKMARAFLSSMFKGDPDAAGMSKQSFKDAVASWFPGIGKKG
jgi:pyruvate dehydrogenase (quinone)